MIVCVGLVLSSLSEPMLASRLEAGPQSPRVRSLQTLAACLVLTLFVCLVSCAVGLVALHEAMASLPGWQVALAFGSNFAFALVPLAIAFLLASVGAREEVLNACGNILGMVMSFMGGAWVPLSFMGPAVVVAAHFFPTYWTNSSVDVALSAASSGLSAAGLGTYLTAWVSRCCSRSPSPPLAWRSQGPGGRGRAPKWLAHAVHLGGGRAYVFGERHGRDTFRNLARLPKAHAGTARAHVHSGCL